MLRGSPLRTHRHLTRIPKEHAPGQTSLAEPGSHSQLPASLTERLVDIHLHQTPVFTVEGSLDSIRNSRPNYGK
jgi:hypothetical protein